MTLLHIETNSLTLIHTGKKLKEMFPQQQGENVFQEPAQAHTKLRWQVVQVAEEKGRARGGEEAEESDNETELFSSRVSFLLQTDSHELAHGQCVCLVTAGLRDGGACVCFLPLAIARS